MLKKTLDDIQARNRELEKINEFMISYDMITTGNTKETASNLWMSQFNDPFEDEIEEITPDDLAFRNSIIQLKNQPMSLDQSINEFFSQLENGGYNSLRKKIN